MKYLYVTKNSDPFYSNYFDYENLYNPEIVICIFDLETITHTFNGIDWIETPEDHL